MKNFKRIITLTLVLSLMFGVTAFAADTDTTRPSAEERAEQFETMLSEQVSEGTITQVEADALIEHFEANTAEKPEKSEDGEKPADGERPDMFAGAVEDGIITQDQADAISEDMEASAPERPDPEDRPEKSEDGERPEKPEGEDGEGPAGPRGGGGRPQSE